MSCPTSHELSAAITERDPAIDAHCATCPTCAAQHRRTSEAIDLARALEEPLPSETHRANLRAIMLAAARTQGVLQKETGPRVSRRALVGIAATVAIAAGALLVVTRRDEAPSAHAHASIRALASATSYQATTRSPDEIVMLYDGSIEVTVAPLHDGERFRVLVGRDEIEVHGTQFVATAHDGALTDVTVSHGVVEVRPQFGAARMLKAGETWRGTIAVVAPPPAPAPPVVEEPAPVMAKRPLPRRPSVTVAPVPAPAAPERAAMPIAVEKPPETERPVEVLPQERAYTDGWAAMRQSRFTEAAKAFLRVQLLDPDGALAEDATYYYAVALARAKSSPQAISAFREMLARYPKAARAGEANAMLGWLLVDTQQWGEARRRFRAALTDSNASVRSSAQAGLDALRQAPE